METETTCPYCGEPISLWVDQGGGHDQSYVEDCSVCCRPMQVHVAIDSGGDAFASVQRSDE
jgi:hypothetical protein